MLGTFAVAALASIAVDGLAPWRAFFGGAARNAAVWAPWIANTASLAGVYARLFDGGPFARPLFAAPALASVAFNVTALALLGAAVFALRQRRELSVPPTSTAPSTASASATATTTASADLPLAVSDVAPWLTFPVLLNPLGWSHVLVMLLAPLVVAARDGGPAARPGLVLLLALLSVPRQTLILLAGPLPVSPGRGLLLGLHAFAALALYVALLRTGRPAPASR
jgi:hypothetical protein